MVLYDLFVANDGDLRLGLLNVVAFIVALLTALILHEISHGLVALWNGDNTAKLYGRLSVNPLKHIDLIGLVFMLIIGFGWARPVPVNPNNFKNKKVGAITVSLAGVLTNLVLAFIATMVMVLLGKVNLTNVSMSVYYTVYFFYQLSYLVLLLNVSFALFNLLPLYPLDGYRLLSCFINSNSRFLTFLRRYSTYILMGLVALNLLSAYISVIPHISPLYWYVNGLGGLIRDGFEQFWRLIFNG